MPILRLPVDPRSGGQAFALPILLGSARWEAVEAMRQRTAGEVWWGRVAMPPPERRRDNFSGRAQTALQRCSHSDRAARFCAHALGGGGPFRSTPAVTSRRRRDVCSRWLQHRSVVNTRSLREGPTPGRRGMAPHTRDVPATVTAGNVLTQRGLEPLVSSAPARMRRAGRLSDPPRRGSPGIGANVAFVG